MLLVAWSLGSRGSMLILDAVVCWSLVFTSVFLLPLDLRAAA